MPAAKLPAAAHYPQVEVRARAELRAWLLAHHGSSAGIWVVTFKKHAPDVHVSAVDVYEEALCFGWIDSLPRALDADRSMLLITPRRPKSAWSRVNKDRVGRLLAEGAMAPAGLAVVAAAKASGNWSALDAVEALELPADLVQRFDAAPAAARAKSRPSRARPSAASSSGSRTPSAPRPAPSASTRWCASPGRASARCSGRLGAEGGGRRPRRAASALVWLDVDRHRGQISVL